MSHGVLPHAAGSSHSTTASERGAVEEAAHQVGLWLTLSYVLLSAVGVVFETLLLKNFGADFLTFAEPEDFLMAGLRHPMVLAFVALSIGLLAAMLWFVRTGTRIWNAYAAWRDRTGSFTVIKLARRVVPYLAVAYYFFIFTSVYASHVADEIRSGEEGSVRVEFQHEAGDSGLQPVQGSLIATTGRYVFLWEPAARQVQVIPTSAVRRMVNTQSLKGTQESRQEMPKSAAK